jgi:hypothetical protein
VEKSGPTCPEDAFDVLAVVLIPDFDPMEPFATKALLSEIVDELSRFEYKLYGHIPLRFHRGEPTMYEFDLNLGLVHFTEQDFKGLSEIFARINGKWSTEMTFCIYPSKEKARDMILNVRGSPLAPAEID